MAEYIKRSDAIDRFTYEHGDLVPEFLEHGEQNQIWVRDVKSVLRSIPAADVAPVVHGHWQLTGLISCRCSECQHLELKGSMEYLYCPHCGAKMDKEDEDL